MSGTTVVVDLELDGAEELMTKARHFPRYVPRIIEANFRTLGVKTTRVMQRVLKPVKYKGHLAGSIGSDVDTSAMTLRVGSKVKEANFVFYGTKPHWAPIAPLKEWARWKLNDESAAYAIQRKIHLEGTNSYAKRGLKGAWQSEHGIGLDYLRLTREAGDFKSALKNTGKRLGADLRRLFERGNNR